MGLGERFLRSVDQAVEALRANPESGPMVFAQIRRLIVPRFPYGLFYIVRDGVVVVLAVVHSRRDTQKWPVGKGTR